MKSEPRAPSIFRDTIAEMTYPEAEAIVQGPRRRLAP
jgi:hypothetical protein